MKKIGKIVLRIVACFFLITVGLVILYRFVPVPVTILMLQRCWEQQAAGKEVKLNKKWVPLDKISNTVQLAVFAAEDQNFLWHHGFDVKAIGKAIEYNEKQQLKRRKKMRGASTITQQTAKNVFLFPRRSFVRKGLEVYFTALIELFWSKQRIMEVYLNVAEMGDGLYGVEAASQFYFRKPASSVNVREAALLAVCLPSPRKFRPDTPTAYLLKRQAFIMNQMRQWGGVLKYDPSCYESGK